ncbi:MAG TPA: right-handed parallel beta-helix repeat-containing protein [Phycisphaerae bacterium]
MVLTTCPFAVAQVTTNGSGAYVVIVPTNWSGVVRPQSPAYSFTPTLHSYLNVAVNQTAQNFMAATVGGNPPVLIEIGDTWHYLKGLAGTPPWAWNQLNFIDSAWLGGPTGIGYGNGDDTTVLNDMYGNYLTVYARHVFSVPNPWAISNLTLQIDYDDGFVAYLNGTEVARRGLGAPGTPVNPNTPASSHAPGTPEQITFSTAGLLLPGTNLLAVEIHNTSLTSGGLSFTPRLTVANPPSPPPPVANGQSVSAPVNTPAPLTLTGSDPNGQSLSFAIGTQPSHGTLGPMVNLLFNSASVTYTSAAGYTGPDSFTFTVNNGTQQSAPAIVVISVAPAGGSATWSPPIGTPAPSFGITQTAPSPPNPWVTPTPGFYCVDQFNLAATNTNNPYGTPALPRVSIPDTLPAGAVVEVRNRYSYAPYGYQLIQVNGTAANPVYIHGPSATQRPDWTRDVYLKGSYGIVENVRFKDHDGTLAGGLYFLSPSDHLVVRSCELSGNLVAQSGVRIESWDTPATVCQHHVVYNNVIHDNGNVNAPNDQDVHGIAVGHHCQNIWVVDNQMYGNSGDGIQINAGPSGQATTHHLYIGRNTSHSNKQSGLWIKQAVDVIFSQNTVYDHRPGNSSPGAGLGEQYGPERVWFLFNHIYDCEYGIMQASASGLGFGQQVYMIGNVIHNIHHTAPFNPNTSWSQAAIMVAAGPGARIVNNTIYDVDAGVNIAVPSPAPSWSTYVLENNIISHVTEPQGHHVFVELLPNQSTLKNTLMYRVGGPILITWPGGYNYTTLASFQSATGQGQACLVAAPVFVDAAGGNFQLAAGSPGVDAGMISGVYATFQSLYGLSINVDYNGTPRPQGGAVDIGAFER